jgi:TPP-dependent pyruvate/acetoin dehydrogenase alpha subunit
MATRVKEPATQKSAEKNGHPLISDAKFKQLYAMMLKCRMLDEKARVLFQRSNINTNGHTAPGWEATAVGIAIDLRPEDTIGLSHRGFMTSFIKGIPLEAIFCEFYSHESSLTNGRSSLPHNGNGASRNHLSSSNIASQLNIALATALANQKRGNGNITVVFATEDSTPLAAWQEALNFAGDHDLPMIFVTQNNLAAPLNQGKSQTKAKTSVYGFPFIPVDGNDVVAVYRVAQESMTRARQGGGPTLIESKVSRDRSKTASDTIDQETVEHWKIADPISKMENYLTGRALFRNDWKEHVANEFNEELNVAVEVAEKISNIGS